MKIVGIIEEVPKGKYAEVDAKLTLDKALVNVDLAELLGETEKGLVLGVTRVELTRQEALRLLGRLQTTIASMYEEGSIMRRLLLS